MTAKQYQVPGTYLLYCIESLCYYSQVYMDPPSLASLCQSCGTIPIVSQTYRTKFLTKVRKSECDVLLSSSMAKRRSTPCEGPQLMPYCVASEFWNRPPVPPCRDHIGTSRSVYNSTCTSDSRYCEISRNMSPRVLILSQMIFVPFGTTFPVRMYSESQDYRVRIQGITSGFTQG